MKKSLLIAFGLFSLAAFATPAPALAVSGLGIGVKAGAVTDYENPNLKLSDFEFNKLKFFGGFFKWGSQVFDLEVGAEHYWDDKNLQLLGEEVSVKAKDFYVGVTGKYYLNFPLIKPFIGAGIAAHNFTFEYNGPLGDYEDVIVTIPDDEGYLGYHLVVGAKLAAAVLPFDLFIESKIGKVNTKPDKTQFTVVSVGMVLNLP